MILVVSGGMKSMLSEQLVEKPLMCGVGIEVRHFISQLNKMYDWARRDDKWKNGCTIKVTDAFKHLARDPEGNSKLIRGSEIEQLKALVLQQQALLDDFRENYVQQAPTDAMTAARDLMAASAHASSLRDNARAEIQEIERFRREHAEELADIKNLLQSRHVIQQDLRKRNRELMQRADRGDYEAIGELEAVAKKPLEVSIDDEIE